jgi:hypothetical protein
MASEAPPCAGLRLDRDALLLAMERVQPNAGVAQDLRTFHVLDAFGNRVRTHTCSSTLTVDECRSTAITFENTDSTGIQRYTRAVYDARGRFVSQVIEPFRNASGGATETTTMHVVTRNAFGDATKVRDVNGVTSQAVFGTLGRPYYTWTQTVANATIGSASHGVQSLITKRGQSKFLLHRGTVVRWFK